MKVNTVTESKILVVKKDDGSDYGNRVYLSHCDGYISMYGHLKDVSHLTNGQKFENKEPNKFKSLKWVKWTKAIKFINPSDKNVIERLFNSID